MFLCLLATTGCFSATGFGLDNGEAQVARVTEKVIGSSATLALVAVDDAPFGEKALFSHETRVVIPASRLKKRDDELPACISLVHVLIRGPRERKPTFSPSFPGSFGGRVGEGAEKSRRAGSSEIEQQETEGTQGGRKSARRIQTERLVTQ